MLASKKRHQKWPQKLSVDGQNQEPWPIAKMLCFNSAFLEFFLIHPMCVPNRCRYILIYPPYPLRFCSSYRCSFFLYGRKQTASRTGPRQRLNKQGKPNKQKNNFTFHFAQGEDIGGSVVATKNTKVLTCFCSHDAKCAA